jgi:Gametolysin peptidase M11
VRPTRFTLFFLLASALLTTGGSAALAAEPGVDVATGTVRIVAIDAPGPETELVTRALADVGGRLLDLPPSQGTMLRSGDTVTVRTVRTDHGPVVTSVTSLRHTGARVGATGTGQPVIGTHTLLVLPVYWSAPDDATQASLTALASATATYWSEQSGGQIDVTTSVRDWVRIADPGSCNSTRIANAALAAHQVALPTSRFDHVLFYFPERADCGWAGLGQVTGSLIWDNGLQLTDVSTHELGHNLGLGHANAASCKDGARRVTLSSSCTVLPYRDYADVMGYATYQATGNLNSALADWLQLTRTVTAAPGERTTVTLAPLAQTDSLRAVRVRVPTGWVYADYRPATGRDVRVPAWAGVQLHLLADGTYPQSRLLDARPTGSQFSAVSLPVGTPWTIPGANLTLTVTSIGTAGAQVEVAPVTAGAAVPVPVITGPTTGSVLGAAAQVGWRVATPVATVRLFVDGLQWAQSSSAALTGAFPLTGLSGGRHALTTQAVDAAGRLSVVSAAVTVTIDPTPPSTPARLALSASGVLSWRPSTDAPAGVAGYRVAMDGAAPVSVGTATSRQVSTPVGRHAWSVTAVDRVGNVSAAGSLVVLKPAGSTLPAKAVTAVTVRPAAAATAKASATAAAKAKAAAAKAKAAAAAKAAAPQLLHGTVRPS